MPPAPAIPPSACRNCDEPLDDRSPRAPARYCPACGQETQVQPPTLREFAQQFGGAYFSTEGALWRTLELLLFKPGELTWQYLCGRRKHYVLPLRLYLTVSVVVLLIMRATVAYQFKVDAHDMPREQPRYLTIELGFGRAGLKDGVFFCDNLPQWVCKRVQRRVDFDPAKLQSEVEALSERFISNLGTAMFLLLPTFAMWCKLVYWGRRMRYTEHLVFAFHVHAYWFVMFGLILSNQDWLAGPAMLAIPVYTLLAMRRVYGGRWWPRLARAALVSMLYAMVMAVALAGVGLWSLLF